MACMATEKSPLAQKRCSLPGPSGAASVSLKLYASHQQRRLSERGLLIYKPNKPDIDLIRDFTNNTRKNSTPNLSLHQNRNTHLGGPSGFNYASRPSFCAATSPLRLDANGGLAGLLSNNNNTVSPNGSIGSGCRKVKLRIQKSGTSKEKYVELQPDPSTASTPDDDFPSFLTNPKWDMRRFSDSAAFHPPSITFTTETRRSKSSLDTGIICSTGDLLTLKCLTSSAQEIRCITSDSETKDMESPSKESMGNRSKSFDATITIAKKGAGSSWFNRRHLPISVKLPLPINSPSVPNSPAPTTGGSSQPPIRAPILTITNEDGENTEQSTDELIEVPSPPTVTPVSSGSSPGERNTVPWNKDGFVLDAELLGSAIENHLRKGDIRRRATFSTLYEAPPLSVDSKVTTRPRSASACVIPVPKDSYGGSSSGRRESLCTTTPYSSGFKPATSRKSSLTTFKSSSATPQRFPWEKGDSPSSCIGTTATDNRFSCFASWESASSGVAPIGSFIRTVADYGAHCIDEEEDIGTDGNNVHVNVNNNPTNNLCKGKSNKLEKIQRKDEIATTSSITTTTTTASSSSKKNESGNGMSICGAIRDFILHSIRS